MITEEKFVHPYNDESGRWEKVAELYAGGYEWDIAAVWRDKSTGRLYGDSEGGCSCFGPFEGGTSWDPDVYTFADLTEITSRDQAAKLVEGVHGEDGVSTTERLDFVRKVEVALGSGRA